MFKKLFPILILLSFLVACAPAAPTLAPAPVATTLPASATPSPAPPTGTARPPTDTPTITPTPIPLGTVTGRIVFFSYRPVNDDILLMNGDGTGLVQLTDNLGDDLLPRWSPDGQKIAYVCGDASGGHVCVMNADGSGLTQLTQNQRGIEALAPAWSPDGTEITFHSNHDGNWEIYVMNVDGSAQTRLTDGPADDVFPAWSPDGQQIVFCSSRDGQYDLYLMDADSAGVNRLTVIGTGDPWETSNCLSNWAPDGTTIAFTSSHKFGHADIYVINVDGSGLTCLTCNIPGAQVDPSWSPDGTQILFDDNRGSLYAMSADGSNLIQLTSEERGHFPSLQP